MERKPKIVILLGPTAVGKTDIALDLASACDGEIISADSMQVYRHLDIGTSKPIPEERARVAHHLIDIVDPDGEFNAALFRELADRVIGRLQGKKTLFVVGGTGLYIRVLTGGIIEGPGPDEKLRKSYREEMKRKSTGTLYRRLQERDPKAAGRIHRNDKVRIVRALEIAELTGEAISLRQGQHGFGDRRYDCLQIGLYRDREDLYERIDRRAEKMVESGLVEETRRILRMGYDEKLYPLQSLGYRYFILYLKGEMPLEEALRSMQRDTRHYARRQMTWFRREGDIEWFQPDEAAALRVRVESFLGRR